MEVLEFLVAVKNGKDFEGIFSPFTHVTLMEWGKKKTFDLFGTAICWSGWAGSSNVSNEHPGFRVAKSQRPQMAAGLDRRTD